MATIILVGIYCFSIVGVTALMVGGSTTAAYAQRGGRGGGGRGGGGRGGGRGRGVGRGVGRGGGYYRGGGRGYGRGYGYGGGYYAPSCYWAGPVRICP
ncbi:hypothetical protein [Bradyrhizobium sp. AUGA SZCCT0042]|uniref:hypothetical protein n=1 Tax=Bradyrhizobium sp. AUGA SZCCT0042 TaxID=2807651 RepID=UPI001BA94130|nr:hypothetical protein [Bradyrhizobium sp. AUGA SZCCT0042]